MTETLMNQSQKNSDKGRKKRRRRAREKGPSRRTMAKLVYMERESPFPFPKIYEPKGFEPTARLGQIQRSLGAIEGIIRSFDENDSRGEIEVEGQRFPCFDARPANRRGHRTPLSELIDQTARFSFWPSFPMEPRRPGSAPPSGLLPQFSLSYVRVGEDDPVLAGRVEVIGKLTRLWRGGFAVTLWSKTRQTYLHTVLVGDYPDPSHVGQHVWVVGRFNAESGKIIFENTAAVRFVEPEMAKAILDAARRQEQEEEQARLTEAEDNSEEQPKAPDSSASDSSAELDGEADLDNEHPPLSPQRDEAPHPSE